MSSFFKRFTLFLIVLSIIAVIFSSCNNHKFKIKGEIYGGGEKTIILQKSDFNGRWLSLDSTMINKNGGFSFSFPTPASPDIYRLSANNQYIYIPVDSTETITVISSYDKFGSDFSLGGSKNAELITDFEKKLQTTDFSDKEGLKEFKRKVFSNYIKDNPGSITSYYILTKTVNGSPLYSPTEKEDIKYFTAVATGFKEHNPDDPRMRLLEETALNALKNRNRERGNVKTLEAEEISLIEIDLPNERGENIKLSSVAGKDKAVVVIFSLLNHPDSPEFNLRLANLYNKLNGKVEYYNVSLDEDRYEWRDAARNLPWITVYSPGQNLSEDALRYNVYQIPSFYLYNEKGELMSRPSDLEELEKTLKK